MLLLRQIYQPMGDQFTSASVLSTNGMHVYSVILETGFRCSKLIVVFLT